MQGPAAEGGISTLRARGTGSASSSSSAAYLGYKYCRLSRGANAGHNSALLILPAVCRVMSKDERIIRGELFRRYSHPLVSLTSSLASVVWFVGYQLGRKGIVVLGPYNVMRPIHCTEFVGILELLPISFGSAAVLKIHEPLVGFSDLHATLRPLLLFSSNTAS